MLATLIAATITLAPFPADTPSVEPTQPVSQIQEDDPGWDCRVHGDAVCGPTNSQGMPAGLYRDGQLVTAWDPAWYGRPELVPAL